ncbi:lysine--tRNA ligase [Candidatus Woesearchaeota archaeon]|nr:lysine--tRNA ligase [Candidatus Woesearchaeota archaeon]
MVIKQGKQVNFAAYHWAFASARKTIKEHGVQDRYTCASGITPSGTIHIGNFREIITVDLVTRAFRRMDLRARHIHSWDDNDVFRKVPKNLPRQEMLREQLRKCIADIPDPFGEEESYAAKHMQDVEEAVARVGIAPEFIRQSVKYRRCAYAEQMKEALEATDVIRSILNEYRKEPLPETWLPVSVFCDRCKKDTITSLAYHGGYELSYVCACGHEETFDFRKKGIAKLVWRVDWPMRWKYEDVHFEPGGKDHSTVGGSFDTGKQIVAEVWQGKAPSYQMYDFIRIKGGGGKISSSAGQVITVQDCLEIYEPEVLRYLFTGTRPNAEFAISFDADVIKIYEDFDRCERVYYRVDEANEKAYEKQKYIYEFSQVDEEVSKIPEQCPLQVGFRHLSTIVQIKDLDEESTYAFFKDRVKNRHDELRLRTRISCVKHWLVKYADEQFRFKLKEKKDERFFSSLSTAERESLSLLREAVAAHQGAGALETAIFSIPKKLGLDTGSFFKLCYRAIIGKEKGPKLAYFIEEIGRERILSLL